MKLIIALCDDEPVQMEVIAAFIEKYFQKYEYELVSAPDGQGLLDKLGSKKADIAFLDIVMPGLKGIELGGRLRAQNKDAIIVYITGYEDYALNAFDIQTFDYIMKPITEPRFQKLLEGIMRRLEQIWAYREKSGVFVFKAKDSMVLLQYNEILYFEKKLRKISIHSSRGEYSFYDSMENLISNLDMDFFIQCHHSYIVNRSKIMELRGDDIYLEEAGKVVPVSRRNKQKVKELLENNLFS